MSYTPRNVLVTGGAGFIGANYVRWLLGEDAGVHIVNLDALTYAGSTDNLREICPVRSVTPSCRATSATPRWSPACCASTPSIPSYTFAATPERMRNLFLTISCLFDVNCG